MTPCQVVLNTRLLISSFSPHFWAQKTWENKHFFLSLSMVSSILSNDNGSGGDWRGRVVSAFYCSYMLENQSLVSKNNTLQDMDSRYLCRCLKNQRYATMQTAIFIKIIELFFFPSEFGGSRINCSLISHSSQSLASCNIHKNCHVIQNPVLQHLRIFRI